MEILRAVVARHHAEKEAALNVGSTVESDEGNDTLNSSIPSIVDEGEARVQSAEIRTEKISGFWYCFTAAGSEN